VLSLIRTTLAREPAVTFQLVYGKPAAVERHVPRGASGPEGRYLTRFRLSTSSRARSRTSIYSMAASDAAKVGQFLSTLIPVDTIDEAFVCGPASMIDEVRARRCLSAGVKREHVHVERFGVPGAATAAPIDDAEAAEARLTLIIDGVKREVDFHRGQHSILEAGRAAGLGSAVLVQGRHVQHVPRQAARGQVKMAKN